MQQNKPNEIQVNKNSILERIVEAEYHAKKLIFDSKKEAASFRHNADENLQVAKDILDKENASKIVESNKATSEEISKVLSNNKDQQKKALDDLYKKVNVMVDIIKKEIIKDVIA